MPTTTIDSPATLDGRDALEDFARASGGWFWQTDAEHRFTYMSESVREITGVAPEWHYGKSRRDFGIPESVSDEEWLAHLEALERHEPFSGFVFRRRGPDGSKWMETSGRPMFDAEGRFLGYRGLAMDVTARVEAQGTVSMLRQAIDQLRESFALWGPDDRLVICNQLFREINSFAPALSAPGTRFDDHIRAVADHEAAIGNIGDRDAWVAERIRRHRDADEPFELKRGDDRWLVIKEQRNADGATVTITSDITAFKRSEMMAEKAKRHLIDAIEALNDGFCLFGPDDRVTVFNAEYAAFYEELGAPMYVGQRFEDLMRLVVARGLVAEASGREEAFVADVLSRHRSPLRSSEVRLIDGRWFRIQETKTADGSTVRFRTDISDLKARQLELEEARRQADIANTAKSSFLANMSHVIRTPLNGIIGLSHILAASRLSDEQARQVRMLEQSSEQLRTIVNDILDFSKIESGNLHLETVPFNLRQTIGGVVDLIDPRIHGKPVNFRTFIDPATPTDLVGDPLRVGQILGNLCSNALKFTSEGDVIVRVGAERTGSGRTWFHFSVSDQGIGMSADQLGRIFQPFTQADASTTRRFGGTGLGLSICQRLAELMGGRIWAESEEGRGSVFHFRLPLGVARGEAVTRHGAPKETTVAAGEDAEAIVAGMRVLVVEDNLLNQEIVAAFSTPRAFWSTWRATGAKRSTRSSAAPRTGTTPFSWTCKCRRWTD